MKRMSVPKGHHVLPAKAHLDGFATDGFLCVFDRVNKTFLRLTPRSATVRNHYYSFVDAAGNKDTTVENPILSGIEGAAIPVIRKLEDHQPISADDRMVLSLFTACMFLRTPAFERIHNRIGDELHRFHNRFIFSSPERVQRMLGALPEHARSADLVTAEELCEFAQQGDYNVKFHRNAESGDDAWADDRPDPHLRIVKLDCWPQSSNYQLSDDRRAIRDFPAA